MNPIAHLLESLRADVPKLRALRRDIHAHPELRFEEKRTSRLIARTLREWGVETFEGIGTTGVVGVVRGGRGDRAIGLRADIDALPMVEKNTFAHTSIWPGKMHACGHDGHTAMLLAAARYLSEHRTFNGTVVLIFQPAEEGAGGARAMLQDGLLRRFPMEAVFGLHNWPGLAVGQFAIRQGPVFASGNRFRVMIRGQGGHAAMPHQSIDPVPVACQIIQSLQTIITRNVDARDVAVLSVTQIQVGEAVNIIADRCEIRGTVRTFSLEVLDLIERRMRKIAESTCHAFGAECEFEFDRYCPPTINSVSETQFVRGMLAHMVGEQNVLDFDPTLGSEDFSVFLMERPGCYVLIGNGEAQSAGTGAAGCMLHNANYDFNDELIPIGGAMWVRLVEAWFAKDSRARSGEGHSAGRAETMSQGDHL